MIINQNFSPILSTFWEREEAIDIVWGRRLRSGLPTTPPAKTTTRARWGFPGRSAAPWECGGGRRRRRRRAEKEKSPKYTKTAASFGSRQSFSRPRRSRDMSRTPCMFHQTRRGGSEGVWDGW